MFFYIPTGDAPDRYQVQRQEARHVSAMRYVLPQFDYPSKDEVVVGELDFR